MGLGSAEALNQTRLCDAGRVELELWRSRRRGGLQERVGGFRADVRTGLLGELQEQAGVAFEIDGILGRHVRAKVDQLFPPERARDLRLGSVKTAHAR